MIRKTEVATSVSCFTSEMAILNTFKRQTPPVQLRECTAGTKTIRPPGIEIPLCKFVQGKTVLVVGYNKNLYESAKVNRNNNYAKLKANV